METNWFETVRDIRIEIPWKVRPRLVTTQAEAVVMGNIRNQCLDGLTSPYRIITLADQMKWWSDVKDDPTHISYVYTVGTEIVGFSHIHYKDGYQYPSVGVIPAERGKGYGREIIQHAMIACGGPMRGMMLQTNETVEKIDLSLGWKITGRGLAEDGRFVNYVEASWPPPFLKKG